MAKTIKKAPPKKTQPAKAAPKKSAAKKVGKKAAAKDDVSLAPVEVIEDDDAIDPELAAELESSFDPTFDPAKAANDETISGDATFEDAALDEDRAEARAVVPEIVSRHAADDDSDAKPEEKGLATVDTVATYLSEIRKYPLLTREEEQALAIRYRETGDPQAAERLVTSNLRFVVKVAAEYSKFGAKLIDLIQEGNVGLMHAVKEFNPYKNVRLITYAVWWIRGYIQEYLMRQYSLVRIGTTQNQRKLFYRLQRERAKLDSVGQEPNFALLSSRLGVPQDEVETMAKRLSGRDVSLSSPLDDGSTTTLLDMEASDEQGVDDALGRREELAVLRQNLDSIRGGLTEKETFILESRILADEPLTLQEIGDKYGVTREAVRQLEARLVGRIRSAVMGSLAARAHEDGARAAAEEMDEGMGDED